MGAAVTGARGTLYTAMLFFLSYVSGHTLRAGSRAQLSCSSHTHPAGLLPPTPRPQHHHRHLPSFQTTKIEPSFPHISTIETSR